MNEWHDPLMELSWAEPPADHSVYDDSGVEDAEYAVARKINGSYMTHIVDVAAWTEHLDRSEWQAVDGTIFWKNVPADILDDVIVRWDVDIDPRDVPTDYLATAADTAENQR